MTINTQPRAEQRSRARRNPTAGTHGFAQLQHQNHVTTAQQGAYKLGASATGPLTGTAGPSPSPGAATKLAFTQQPSSSSTGGANFPTQPIVTIQDSSGDTVTNNTSSVSLAITAGTGTSGAKLSCTSLNAAGRCRLLQRVQYRQGRQRVHPEGDGHDANHTDGGNEYRDQHHVRTCCSTHLHHQPRRRGKRDRAGHPADSQRSGRRRQCHHHGNQHDLADHRLATGDRCRSPLLGQPGRRHRWGIHVRGVSDRRHGRQLHPRSPAHRDSVAGRARRSPSPWARPQSSPSPPSPGAGRTRQRGPPNRQ